MDKVGRQNKYNTLKIRFKIGVSRGNGHHRFKYAHQRFSNFNSICGFGKKKLTASSFPSPTNITIRPSLFRPVRPILCTKRIGEFEASKQMMRSTSPISKPSSPTEVDTTVL